MTVDHACCSFEFGHQWYQSLTSLVENPQEAIQDICEFCGIPFDEKWSDFHNVPRRVDTASAWQVRKPIYRTSVHKWTNYAPFLGPLLTLENDDESDE